MLFGVFAVHSPELCPLNNEKSKKIFLNLKSNMDEEMKKYNINKIVEFYMSVLEHEWIIVIDAIHAHDIEKLCIDVGISSISTVKIVPMNLYSDTIKKLEASKAVDKYKVTAREQKAPKDLRLQAAVTTAYMIKRMGVKPTHFWRDTTNEFKVILEKELGTSVKIDIINNF